MGGQHSISAGDWSAHGFQLVSHRDAAGRMEMVDGSSDALLNQRRSADHPETILAGVVQQLLDAVVSRAPSAQSVPRHSHTTRLRLSTAATLVGLKAAAAAAIIVSVILLLVSSYRSLAPYHADRTATLASPLAVLDLSDAPLPAVCMSGWPSRWGNHIYRTMFLLSAASRHGLHPYLPAWDSGFMGLSAQFFSTCPAAKNDSSVVHVLVAEQKQWGGWFDQHPLTNLSGHQIVPASAASDPLSIAQRGVAVYSGYCQYHHSGFRPYKDVFAAHMRPEARREWALEQMWHRLLFALDDTVLLVAVHVRRGDYGELTDGCFHCRIPVSWYVSWLEQLRANHTLTINGVRSSSSQLPLRRALQSQQAEERQARQTGQSYADPLVLPPVGACSDLFSLTSSVSVCLLVVSDAIEQVSAEFRAANEHVLTSADVLRYLPTGWELDDLAAPHALDWWLMTRAAMLAVSQSSFSYTASLFSRYSEMEGEGHFWRPQADVGAMSAFDPWSVQYVDNALQRRRGKGRGRDKQR